MTRRERVRTTLAADREPVGRMVRLAEPAERGPMPPTAVRVAPGMAPGRGQNGRT